VRVDGTDLVAGDRRVPLTGTVAAVAAAAGLAAGVPQGLYNDHADWADGDPQSVDAGAAGALGDWFDRGDAGLRAFTGGEEPDVPFTADVALNPRGRTLDCAALPPLEQAMGGHSAPLGLSFVDGGLPGPYGEGALVGVHGSWNASPPRGPHAGSAGRWPDQFARPSTARPVRSVVRTGRTAMVRPATPRRTIGGPRLPAERVLGGVLDLALELLGLVVDLVAHRHDDHSLR
jgi:hypothetical protein